MKNWKNRIAIFVLVILFILGFWFIITSKKSEKTFKPLMFNDNNFVNNRTKINYLDTLVLAGLSELDIKNMSILILPLKNTEVDDISLKAHIRKAEGGYIIWIDELSRSTNIEVIAHELIHLQQYENNSLYLKNDSLFWKDQIFSINSLPSYEERDWENDAFIKQEGLKTKMKNILY